MISTPEFYPPQRSAAALVFSLAMGPLIFAPAANGQPVSQAAFHAMVVSNYSFEPHTLSRDQQKAKSAVLDTFWDFAKADPAARLPLLRKELGEPSNSAFFHYDGAQLLMSLSTDPADQVLALKSIPRADLRGVDRTDYLRTVQRLASKGNDTREAAFRILDYPEFQAFIPQHALTLGQDYSLIYMLYPMDETTFAADLATRLAAEKNAKSQKSLILALFYLVTPEGEAVIKQFADGAGNPAEAAEYARKLLTRKPSLLSSFTLSTERSLREERRKMMQRPISDEALMEFDVLTFKIMAKR